MITPKFLQGCTKEQINMGVAWKKIKSLPLMNKEGVRSELYRLYSNALISDVLDYGFDPCTYPNDAWPIIISNSIEISGKPEEYSGQARASSFVGGLFSVADGNEGLLRAAMEVYLLMGNKS